MQLKNLFLAVPRSTWETLAKYHIVRPSLLVWYDLIRFFDQIDLSPEAQKRRLSKLQKPLSQMDKYYLTADRFHLDPDHTRKIINKFNRYV